MKTLILIIAFTLTAYQLHSKNFNKNEDIINDILNERPVGGGKKDARQEMKKSLEPQKKAEKDEKDGDDKKSLSMTSSDEVIFKTGTQLIESRLFSDAEKKFRELLEQYPQSKFRDSANYWLGIININENRYDDAIKSLMEIKKTDSGEYPAAQFKIGECYQYKGDSIKAIEYFRRIFSLFPANELADNALLRMGKIYLNLKKRRFGS